MSWHFSLVPEVEFSCHHLRFYVCLCSDNSQYNIHVLLSVRWYPDLIESLKFDQKANKFKHRGTKPTNKQSLTSSSSSLHQSHYRERCQACTTEEATHNHVASCCHNVCNVASPRYLIIFSLIVITFCVRFILMQCTIMEPWWWEWHSLLVPLAGALRKTHGKV